MKKILLITFLIFSLSPVFADGGNQVKVNLLQSPFS